MISDKLFKLYSRKLFRKASFAKKISQRFYPGSTRESTTQLFFTDSVQDLLKKLTCVDLEKVYSPRKEGVRYEAPVYKFMTTDEYEQVRKDAEDRATTKLQMPPVMDTRQEIDHVFVKDDKLMGYSDSKFIFTDITNGIDDRLRNIVVRDEDGTLREARWQERDRMNQVYFPRSGRKLIPPKLFDKENLKRLLENGEYLFVLDSACSQFEPDDPTYIQVCQDTYTAVDSECAYNKLRSTRHYGPFVFFLAKSKSIDNLLMENIATDRVEDAVWLISLYHILNPGSKSASKSHTIGKELEFIENYIKEDSGDREKLELTLQTYREYLESPKSEESHNI